MVERWLHESGVAAVQRIAVANRPGVTVPSGFSRVEGSNRGLDLGGYAEGLRELQCGGYIPDAVILVNDRLPAYESVRPVLGRISAATIGSLQDTTAAVGFLWSWHRAGTPSGRVRYWLQSHCLLVSRSVLERLDLPTLLMEHGRDSVRLGDTGLVVDQDVDGSLTALLEEWSMARGAFDRLEPLRNSSDGGPDWIPQFLAKAETVLREIRLSDEILRAGGTLLDTRGLGSGWLDRRRIRTGGGVVRTAGSSDRAFLKRAAGRLGADAGAALARLSRP